MKEMKKLVIVGATSAICEQILRLILSDLTSSAKRLERALYLTGRNKALLNAIRDDLKAQRAVKVTTETLDLLAVKQCSGLIDRAQKQLNGLDTVILAAGLLPDQAQLEKETDLLYRTFTVNALSVMAIMNEAANFFQKQNYGQIVVIGSVAGDRGRANNYGYGAAKGALEIFISGLRQRLYGTSVKILLAKPGFVDTPMTTNLKKKGLLWAKPERVAADIVRAMQKGKSVVYTPWFWYWIMLLIRWLPEPIFLRLKF